MRILFDQGTPAPLRQFLQNHEVTTAYEQGWSTLENGDLLSAAEGEGLHIPVATDTNLKYQQNLALRSIAIIVPGTTSRPRIKASAELVLAAVNASTSGTFSEVQIPKRMTVMSAPSPDLRLNPTRVARRVRAGRSTSLVVILTDYPTGCFL
jgi:hypothetical protein